MFESSQNLEEFFLDPRHSTETSGMWAQYRDLYNQLNTFLKNEVYPFVVTSSLAADRKGYLTDHGALHVKTVMNRASSLIRHQPAFQEITWYEAYILLTAILVHDIGMLHGRDKHEQDKLHAVMKTFSDMIAKDAIERRNIRQIASAHGGSRNGNKDTISSLLRETPLMNFTIKPQAMAALLRFADELADDSSRAARYLLANNLVPPESEIYHKYASILHSVKVYGTSVELYFDFQRSDALRQFHKGDDSVYLIDEIHERVRKMHYERVYCMRYLREWIHIDRLMADIKISEDDWGEVIEHISYSVEEEGYPQGDQPVCYTFNNERYRQLNAQLTGQGLHDRLSANSTKGVEP